jgi:hypothetical protein
MITPKDSAVADSFRNVLLLVDNAGYLPVVTRGVPGGVELSGPSRATQKQFLVGLKQGETKRTEVEDLQPTFQ